MLVKGGLAVTQSEQEAQERWEATEIPDTSPSYRSDKGSRTAKVPQNVELTTRAAPEAWTQGWTQEHTQDGEDALGGRGTSCGEEEHGRTKPGSRRV